MAENAKRNQSRTSNVSRQCQKENSPLERTSTQVIQLPQARNMFRKLISRLCFFEHNFSLLYYKFTFSNALIITMIIRDKNDAYVNLTLCFFFPRLVYNNVGYFNHDIIISVEVRPCRMIFFLNRQFKVAVIRSKNIATFLFLQQT